MSCIRKQNEKQITVARYIRMRDRLINTMFVIKPSGEGFFILNGVEYTREEFKKKFSLPVSLIAYNNSDTADPRRNWLQN